MAKKKQEPEIVDLKFLQDTLYVIGGKWKLPIMFTISKGHKRYKEIQRNIPGITSRMLSKELKELELNKIITRTVKDDFTVRINYEITDYCSSFDPVIRLMINWGKQHRQYLKKIDKSK